jgi:uncharacterized protein (DUF1786 family)
MYVGEDCMKILAMDIGAGTSDILLYDDRKESIENCIKMVLPSPSLVHAAKVRNATRLYQDIFVKGSIIGGGAFTSALRRHLEHGLRVLMSEYAAYTVRNILDQVKDLGIEIIKGNKEPSGFDGVTLNLEEVHIDILQNFLRAFDETLLDVDVVAIAVQDHGVFPKGTSNRKFRIRKIQEALNQSSKPESLAFTEDEIPSYYLRMNAAAVSSRSQLPNARVLLMDTSPAAVLGCLQDITVKNADPVLAVNVGNGHTMAAIISGGHVAGVMEHHTRALTPQKIEQLLVNFADGQLYDTDVFNDGGHGVFYLSHPLGFSQIQTVAATGPNRSLLAKTDLSVHFAAPAGDVMMTGPIGLIEAAKKKFDFT